MSDWKFNIAYNAALQLASAALAAAGYEAERAQHHHRVIHSLEFSLGLQPEVIRMFELFRKKRNITDYEEADTISETEAAQIRDLAKTLRRVVELCIRKNHPELLS